MSSIASCYATAINAKPKSTKGHVGLGLVMEELFYTEDLYGHKAVTVSVFYNVYHCVIINNNFLDWGW